ncbi:uncharacterized protein TNCV_676251 [Trichonephila clavipes]|nr:uncharacterized protein TNCV_676241 [Trichonephila clavipes]GFW32466.1 uncharacterized protein TNCV_676251 [Trichonephila clavipes]
MLAFNPSFFSSMPPSKYEGFEPRYASLWMSKTNTLHYVAVASLISFCLQHHDGRIRVWRHRGESPLNCCIMHRHISPVPGIMVWGGIGFHCRMPLVLIAGTLNSQRYSSEVLEPVLLTYIQRLPSAIFQYDNARPHMTRIASLAVLFSGSIVN